MDNVKLRQLYGQLKGINNVITFSSTIGTQIVLDYNNIVKAISKILDENLDSFLLSNVYYFESQDNRSYCYSNAIIEKLFQFISYLDYGYPHLLSEKVIVIGGMYNSIIDEDLKSRCSDILSAPDHFDRVINQSTQVLEDRIRTKSGCDKSLIGVHLVNTVLNPDIKKTILITSEDNDEHKGICDICRGLMQSFRNPTHHFLTDSYSREEALKLCAFIDNILQIIDKAKVNKSNK